MNRVLKLCLAAGIALSGPAFALTAEERSELSTTCDDVPVHSERAGPSAKQSATESSDQAPQSAPGSQGGDGR
jgi:hypothetical protein